MGSTQGVCFMASISTIKEAQRGWTLVRFAVSSNRLSSFRGVIRANTVCIRHAPDL